MKKSVIIVVIVLLFGLCISVIASSIIKEEKREYYKSAQAKDEKALIPDTAIQSPSKPANSNQNAGDVVSANDIGKDKAKEIALNRVGIKESEADFIRVEYDREDGLYVYEVEIIKDRVEYDVTIKADDGKILEYDVDYD